MASASSTSSTDDALAPPHHANSKSKRVVVDEKTIQAVLESLRKRSYDPPDKRSKRFRRGPYTDMAKVIVDEYRFRECVKASYEPEGKLDGYEDAAAREREYVYEDAIAHLSHDIGAWCESEDKELTALFEQKNVGGRRDQIRQHLDVLKTKLTVQMLKENLGDALIRAIDSYRQFLGTWRREHGDAKLDQTGYAQKQLCIIATGEEISIGDFYTYIYLDLDEKLSSSPQCFANLSEDAFCSSVIYVGKGQGGRLFDHVSEALDSKQTGPKVDKIRNMWRKGRGPRVVRVYVDICERLAFHFENLLVRSGKFPHLTNVGPTRTSYRADASSMRSCMLAVEGARRVVCSLPCVSQVICNAGV